MLRVRSIGHILKLEWSSDFGLVIRLAKFQKWFGIQEWEEYSGYSSFQLEYFGIHWNFPGLFFSAHADWSQSSRGREWGPSESVNVFVLTLHSCVVNSTRRPTSRRWCLLAIFWTSCSCELGVVSLRQGSCILHHGHVQCYCWYAWKFQLWWCAVCLVCGVDLCAMPEYPFPQFQCTNRTRRSNRKWRIRCTVLTGNGGCNLFVFLFGLLLSISNSSVFLTPIRYYNLYKCSTPLGAIPTKVMIFTSGINFCKNKWQK